MQDGHEIDARYDRQKRRDPGRRADFARDNPDPLAEAFVALLAASGRITDVIVNTAPAQETPPRM
jgi:hypothetical protein